MKTLFIIRHAKSSWEDPQLADIDRPLNKRGLRDAPFMAKMLKARAVQANKIITSPANRAYTTATYFANEMNINKLDIVVKNEMYHAYPRDILKIVNEFGGYANTLMVFGHNPGFTSLANLFSEDYIANVPTCGIVEISSSTSKWKSFTPENSKRVNFYYPKMYL